jgi:spore germination protein KC
MKRRIIRIICILALLLPVLSLSGCWDEHELDTLSIVTGVGIDAGRQPDEIDMVVQVGKVMQSATAKDKSADQNSFQLLEISSQKIMDAIEALNRKSTRKLFMPHNMVILFGRDQAEKGVRPYLDYFIRDDETRMEVKIFVAGDTAKAILSVKPEQEKITAMALMRMMENEMHKSEILTVSLLDFTSRLIDNTTAPVAPVVQAVEENGSTKLALTGMGVFRDDRLAGILHKSFITGYLWASGGAVGSTLDVSTDTGSAVLNVSGASCKTNLSLQDGNVTVSLKISGQLSVNEMRGFHQMKMTEVFPKIEQAAMEEIKKKVMECFYETQQLNTDIYGFGVAVHRKYPSEWKTMEQEWDRIYPTVALSADVDINLTNTGKIADSLDMEKGHE